MAIPMSSGGPRKFQFKTAPLRGGEGQGKGNMECVHQAIEHLRQQQLTCMGPLEHRLTVQATDDVYDRTKKLMKEAEEQRKEARAQEIKLVSKGRSKAKAILANAGSGGTPSPARKLRPPPHHKSPSPFSGKPLSGKPSAANSRSPRSLRDRIIHLLALKPQKRPDIVTRLKKDTKRSESAMSNLDSILSEVSDIQHGTHCLRSHHYSDLNVDTWPFYSEAERQLVKRKVAAQLKHSAAADTVSSSESPFLPSLPSKRPLSTSATASTRQIETPPKKQKLSHFSSPPPPLPPHSHSNQQPPPSSLPSLDPPFTAPTSGPHRPPPHPLQSSTSVQQQQQQQLQQQQARKSYAGVPSNPSIRQPPYSLPPAPSVSVPLSQPQSQPQPQPIPAVLKAPAIATSVASHASLTHYRQSFVPASSATVTNGLTISSTSSAGSTGLSLPSARVQESPKQHMEPVQPVQPDEPVKPEGGEKKRKDKKKEKKKKKEKDRERSQDSTSKEPSSVQQRSSGSQHGSQEATQRGDQKQPEAAAEQPTCTDASSTSNIPDYISQFPPIKSEAQRSEYKRVFNEEYVEYLRIKECMDALKEECAHLGERMSQVSKSSGEAKEVRKKIKEKYTELQESKHQQRFEELHFKLSHIKQLVVDFDRCQPHTASVQ